MTGVGKSYQLAGVRFGMLVALDRFSKDKKGSVLWRCQCDCGAEKVVTASNLMRGNSRSCGCVPRQKSRERCLERNALGTNAEPRASDKPVHPVMDVLRKRRVAMGWSQEKLATIAGYPKTRLAAWEIGVTDPGITAIGDLAQALGMVFETNLWEAT